METKHWGKNGFCYNRIRKCEGAMMAGVVFKKSLLVLPVYRHLATTVGPQPHFLIIIIIIPEFNFYFN